MWSYILRVEHLRILTESLLSDHTAIFIDIIRKLLFSETFSGVDILRLIELSLLFVMYRFFPFYTNT